MRSGVAEKDDNEVIENEMEEKVMDENEMDENVCVWWMRNEMRLSDRFMRQDHRINGGSYLVYLTRIMRMTRLDLLSGKRARMPRTRYVYAPELKRKRAYSFEKDGQNTTV